ncbi:MAG TPA: hypothetical protein VIP52_10375 [Candidatus Dormibacteraeota bacterium]|jgi:hypothetical protein
MTSPPDTILGPRNAPNLERRSRLRRLDDLLEALEALNLQNAPAVTAAVAARLNELGISSSGSAAPFADLIDGVLKAQERYMIQAPPEVRQRRRRAPFNPETLRFTSR